VLQQQAYLLFYSLDHLPDSSVLPPTKSSDPDYANDANPAERHSPTPARQASAGSTQTLPKHPTASEVTIKKTAATSPLDPRHENPELSSDKRKSRSDSSSEPDGPVQKRAKTMSALAQPETVCKPNNNMLCGGMPLATLLRRGLGRPLGLQKYYKLQFARARAHVASASDPSAGSATRKRKTRSAEVSTSGEELPYGGPQTPGGSVGLQGSGILRPSGHSAPEPAASASNSHHQHDPKRSSPPERPSVAQAVENAKQADLRASHLLYAHLRPVADPLAAAGAWTDDPRAIGQKQIQQELARKVAQNELKHHPPVKSEWDAKLDEGRLKKVKLNLHCAEAVFNSSSSAQFRAQQQTLLATGESDGQRRGYVDKDAPRESGRRGGSRGGSRGSRGARGGQGGRGRGGGRGGGRRRNGRGGGRGRR
jgi:hypothetical protein